VPEGHTVHRLARRHRRLLRGETVAVTSPQGRFAADAALVSGHVLTGTDAWGKHLFHAYDNGLSVHVHLGIYGEFHERQGPVEPRDTTRMRLIGGAHVIDLIGPTRCEVIDDAGKDAIVSRLGPDPLRRGADVGRFVAKLRTRKGPIGPALMDQTVIAGVGNVFRAEALFLHGIHPLTPIPTLSDEQVLGLWSTLQRMLEVGVKEGRIMTVDETEFALRRRDLTRENGRYVYRQEACLRCGTAVRRWDLSGRWAYACEACQPVP
jgi:endonuclease-8